MKISPILVILALWGPTRTWAQPVDTKPTAARAAALYDDGKRHFDIGEYAAAIASWKQAYLASSEPLLLFNIAQAYRLSGDCAHANRFYANYLRATPKPPNQAELEIAMAKCKGVEPATSGADAAPGRSAEEQQRIEAARKAEEDARTAAEEARRAADDARRQAAEDQQRRAEARRREDEDRRLAGTRQDGGAFYDKWWFWTAVGAVAVAAGSTAYYFSGSTTYAPPSGSLGSLDRQ